MTGRDYRRWGATSTPPRPSGRALARYWTGETGAEATAGGRGPRSTFSLTTIDDPPGAMLTP